MKKSNDNIALSINNIILRMKIKKSNITSNKTYKLTETLLKITL